jgi:hypothetical protein
MPRRLSVVLSFVLYNTLFPAVPPAAAAAIVVARTGDASSTHDLAAGTWSIAAGGTTLTLALDPGSDFQMVGLVAAQNRSWVAAAAPDTSVTVDGVAQAFGNRLAGSASLSDLNGFLLTVSTSRLAHRDDPRNRRFRGLPSTAGPEKSSTPRSCGRARGRLPSIAPPAAWPCCLASVR